MHTVTSVVCLILFFSASVRALPFAEQKRQAPAYSVVPVDGGASTELPSTIVQTLPASTQTIVSTSIVTESESESTILVTSITTASPSTETVETTITTEASEPIPTVPGFTYSATETSVSSLTATATDSYTTSSIVYSTVTESPAPSTTQYYDDGLWHTFYPVKTFATPSAWSGTVTMEKRAGTNWTGYATATPVYAKRAATGYAAYEAASPAVPTYVKRAAAGYARPDSRASAIGKRGYAAPTLAARVVATPQSSSLPLLQKYENGKWEIMYSKPVNDTSALPVRRSAATYNSAPQETEETSPFIPAVPVSSKPYHVVSYDSPSYNVTKPWSS
ncbi:hypothetical protein EV356DRAFT_497776 [Viridothelium virens]|uniref:Uncharacterized protein n=1 Tax=Viridothelium virens TaxID=1048519 RepID=A0A6A6HFE3_VIRVR|nr:hypothetical protein EV356DRAFT_497776 [Viridothelium virens]